MDAETAEYYAMLRKDPCAYCGQTGQIVIDHIVPVTEGGENHWSNFTASCRRCNASKGAKSLVNFTIHKPIGRVVHPRTTKAYGHTLTAYIPDDMEKEFRQLRRRLEIGDERGNISRIMQDAIKQRIEELKQAKGEKR